MPAPMPSVPAMLAAITPMVIRLIRRWAASRAVGCSCLTMVTSVLGRRGRKRRESVQRGLFGGGELAVGGGAEQDRLGLAVLGGGLRGRILALFGQLETEAPHQNPGLFT